MHTIRKLSRRAFDVNINGFSMQIAPRCFCLLAGLLALVLAGHSHAQAQTNSGVTIGEIKVGVDNHFRLGCWTQAHIRIQTKSAIDDVRIELELPDGEGMRSVYVMEHVSFPAGDSVFDASLKFGRVNSDLAVRVLDSDGTLLGSRQVSAEEMPNACLASRFLVVTLGEKIGVGEALSLRRQKEDQRPIHLEVNDATTLPVHWLGYGGVNLVVMPTSQNSVASQMTKPQIEALKQWVRMGGRLLISAGEESEPLLTEDAPVADLLPGTFDRVRMQRETSNFEGFAGKTKVSLTAYTREGETSFRLPMAALTDVTGNVVLSEGIGIERAPAIIRSSYGFGQVVFLAVDLDLAPFAKWSAGRRRILGKLIDLSLGDLPRDESNYQFSQLTQIGFGDLAGQLRSALDQFQSINLVPFSWIAILIGIYILMIGPIDYFLLLRWKKRFGMTWLTFPLLVLAACSLAYYLTQFWKGQALQVNQVSVVDIEADSGSMRGMHWSHVFSPKNAKYDCELAVASDVFPSLELDGAMASWQGLPGTSFGGMNNQRLNSSEQAYEIVQPDSKLPATKLSNLPIDIYGSRSLSGLVWGKIDLPKTDTLTADIDNQVSGTIRNPLPVGLKSCQLCFGRWVYPLPSLAPGGTTTLDQYSKVKTIDGMLTKTQVDQDFKDLSQPWDRKSFDISRIMEMMMFHKAGGGTNYTSLLHRFQQEIDFTDHLTQERAILIGKIASPTIRLLQNEEAETASETYVRIMLPVTRTLKR